jgi:hypothetical protein
VQSCDKVTALSVGVLATLPVSGQEHQYGSRFAPQQSYIKIDIGVQWLGFAYLL